MDYTKWKNAYGFIIDINKMTIAHIRNCINALNNSQNRGGFGYYFNLSNEDIEGYLNAFEVELKRRGE